MLQGIIFVDLESFTEISKENTIQELEQKLLLYRLWQLYENHSIHLIGRNDCLVVLPVVFEVLLYLSDYGPVQGLILVVFLEEGEETIQTF